MAGTGSALLARVSECERCTHPDAAVAELERRFLAFGIVSRNWDRKAGEAKLKCAPHA